ncbi:hypothetical protein BC940DRAFT_308768 [Gongronella butleri]|nr:hypothetical protein BC940DRAFT_308768 [Gongronella butleri]
MIATMDHLHHLLQSSQREKERLLRENEALKRELERCKRAAALQQHPAPAKQPSSSHLVSSSTASSVSSSSSSTAAGPMAVAPTSKPTRSVDDSAVDPLPPLPDTPTSVQRAHSVSAPPPPHQHDFLGSHPNGIKSTPSTANSSPVLPPHRDNVLPTPSSSSTPYP